MKIFFSVGEPSGDLHGANLIRELRAQNSDIVCVGYGGPKMAAAGCALHEDLTRLAVMWFLRVLLNIRVFYQLLKRAERYFEEQRPDAVVLIDYPGFNWWIARKAKRRGIPVFYYGAPQMWAWAGWRVGKMRRLVDHVLCKLPFECTWYQERGCNATYVGHPYFDEMQNQQLDTGFIQQFQNARGPLVTILPGSRTQEVALNLPAFLKAAKLIHRVHPTAQFAIAAFNERQALTAREQLPQLDLPIAVFVDKTPELIAAADCCLACSGSVSLELLHHMKPTVIHYRISRIAMWVQRYVRTVKFITLVNLLASREPLPGRYVDHDPDSADAEQVPFPEYLTAADQSSAMAARIAKWLSDPSAKAECVAQLQELKSRYAFPGASAKAARYLLDALNQLPNSAASERRAA